MQPPLHKRLQPNSILRRLFGYKTSIKFSLFSDLFLVPAAFGLFCSSRWRNSCPNCLLWVLLQFPACFRTISKADACLVAAVLAYPRRAWMLFSVLCWWWEKVKHGWVSCHKPSGQAQVFCQSWSLGRLSCRRGFGIMIRFLKKVIFRTVLHPSKLLLVNLTERALCLCYSVKKIE